LKKGILKTTHRKHLQGLIDKSRIFVEKGRILMGCIDETGLLDENEVFIKCDNVLIMRDEEINEDKYEDNESLDYTILKGKIAVAKNPCMHPGDIRVLNAVDKPQLRHLVNCIVFPSKGK
jgi:RNA-dependent RNA polymerase